MAPLSMTVYNGNAMNRLFNSVIIMRPSSLGGGRILRRTLSVRLSVRPSRYCFCLFYSRTVLQANIQNRKKKLLFSLMGQRHVCSFRHAQRAAYRTAISAAQIIVFFLFTRKIVNSNFTSFKSS